jgi:predicted DNA-binding transcriptional regulator AlpA
MTIKTAETSTSRAALAAASRTLSQAPTQSTSSNSAIIDLGDRFVFDEDLTPIDRMCRSARRNAINHDGYPKPRRIGLRSAWLLSEVLAWMKAKPTIYEKAGSGTSPRKALSEGVKTMRRRHGQHIAEASAGEVTP